MLFTCDKYTPQNLLLSITILAIFSAQGCSTNSPYIRNGISATKPNVDYSKIKHRVLLIGDAGNPKINFALQDSVLVDPVLKQLSKRAAEIPQKTIVVFLGDNIYEVGLPPLLDKQNAELASKKLQAQINVVNNSKAHGIFVPGNHDWQDGEVGGWGAIKRQESYINKNGSEKAVLLPGNGCPGPAKYDLEDLRLILVDTQWWLHPNNDKPLLDCYPQTKFSSSTNTDSLIQVVEEAFIDSLNYLANHAGKREVLVMAHHPLVSHGPHAGFLEWKDYILPFPFIKPLIKILKIDNRQNLSSSEYRKLIEIFRQAFTTGRKPLLIASGHEHSLQILEGKNFANYLLISGSGSITKVTPVSQGDDTLFALSRAGFMELNFTTANRILLNVFALNGKNNRMEIVISIWL